MKKDVERSVRERTYQSPSRARAAITRSHLSAKKKARLNELVDVWEGEGSQALVVGGLPDADVRANGKRKYTPRAGVVQSTNTIGLTLKDIHQQVTQLIDIAYSRGRADSLEDLMRKMQGDREES